MPSAINGRLPVNVATNNIEQLVASPKSSSKLSKQTVKKLLLEWSKRIHQDHDDDSYITEETLDGILLHFKAFPSNYIKVSIIGGQMKSEEIPFQFRTEVIINASDNMKELLQFAADSMVVSLQHEMMSVIMNQQSHFSETVPCDQVADTESKPAFEASDIFNSAATCNTLIQTVVKSWCNCIQLSTSDGLSPPGLFQYVNRMHDWAASFSSAGFKVDNVQCGVKLMFLASPSYTLEFNLTGNSPQLLVSANLYFNETAAHMDTTLSFETQTLIVSTSENLIENLRNNLRNSCQQVAPKTRNIPSHLVSTIVSESTDEAVVLNSSSDRNTSFASASKPRQSVQSLVDPYFNAQAKKIGLRLENFKDVEFDEDTVRQVHDLMTTPPKSGMKSYIDGVKEIPIGKVDSVGNLVQTSVDVNSLLANGVNMLTEQAVHLTDFNTSFTKSDPLQEAFVHLNSIPSTMLPMHDSKNPASMTAAATTSSALLDPAVLMDEQILLQLVTELDRSDENMHDVIMNSFKDLYLSNNFLDLMKRKSQESISPRISQLYSKIVSKAVETISLLAEHARVESIPHLETIREVCYIASKYQNDDIKFQNEMDRIRDRFSVQFLSFLKYAIDEENNRLLRLDVEPAKTPSTWLQILTVVYNGVLNELEIRFNRLLDPLIAIIRFEQPEIRSDLFKRIVEGLPPLDLPYIKALAQNLVDYFSTQR